MKRRDFIYLVGASAGSVYAAMTALDLLKQPATARSKFEIFGNSKGKKIVILGAGIAGMAAAYELGKVGYDCTILEARERAGGRCWTVRQGTVETEISGERQVANFNAGLYFNPGPARIPQHHITLDYCQELGVPIEVFTNVNEAAYYYNEGVGPLSNRPVRIREAKTDMRGYMTELLAKAIDQDALDLPLTTEDIEKMLEFLRREGNLSPDLFYKGSSRRGYRILPGAGLQPGEPYKPFDLKALIQSGFGNYFFFEYSINQQMLMFQPVGGMDRIAKAFENRVGNLITYQAEVKEIRKTPRGVRVMYTDKTGKRQQMTGDFCICTIPLSVLKNIPADFSPDMKAAINSVVYLSTGKIGLQFKRRFWEEDDGIMGGISRTNQNITQIFYPSYGYLSSQGILVGYYNFGEAAVEMGNLSAAERQARALTEGGKIHPQYPQEFETGFSVAWHKIKYNLGGWATYTGDLRQQFYPRLNQPDGPIYLAGEHLSYYTGWMAGALESTRTTVAALHQRVQNG
ncbi:MAG: flavin monoamine oxidase family protein [Hormoscilla sp. GUM202]|nr:flavin monoamine oxidase family protein [Hormoscilla sp. GUM202]